jgi:hypothetical protein
MMFQAQHTNREHILSLKVIKRTLKILLFRKNIKVTLSLCLIKHYAMNTYPRILDLGINWRCVVNFTLRPLYPREKSPPRYQLDGPQSLSGWHREGKIPDPTGIRTPTLRSSIP